MNLDLFKIIAVLVFTEASGSIIQRDCLEGKKIPNPGDCTKFFTCKNGVYEPHECPDLTKAFFDTYSRTCADRNHAMCFTYSKGENECSLGRKYPAFGKCNKYLSCVTDIIGSAYGRWNEAACPDFFSFDTFRQQCVQGLVSTCDFGECIKTLTGHKDYVTALTTLSDGNIASGSFDGTIKFWNIETGECTKTITGHSLNKGPLVTVNSLITMENGYIISGSMDESIKIWDKTGKEIRTLQNNMPIYSIANLGEGTIATGTSDEEIRIWNIMTGKVIKSLKGRLSFYSVNSLLVMENKNLISASGEELRIWDLSKNHPLKILKGHKGTITSVIDLSNGNIASSSIDHTIKIWNTDTETSKRTLTGHTSPVTKLVKLVNGNIASASFDGKIKIWNIDTKECIKTLEGHTDAVKALETLQNGNLISGSGDKTIRIWDFKFYD